MKNHDASQPSGEILLYQTEDGRTRIECQFEDNTLWLSQTLMADLFQTTVPNINLHIKNILSEGDLTEAATIKDHLIVRVEGARQVRRPVKYYSLDMIIAVGYRVSLSRPQNNQLFLCFQEASKPLLVPGLELR